MTEFPNTQATLLAAIKSPENRRAWDEFIEIYRPGCLQDGSAARNAGCGCPGRDSEVQAV